MVIRKIFVNTRARGRMGKIKILHLIASNSIGGAERVLLTTAEYIDREKFEIVFGLFAYEAVEDEPFWQEAIDTDFTLRAIRVEPLMGFMQVIDMLRIGLECRPDIVHSHNFKTNILGFFLAKLFGSASVTTFHGWLHTEKVKTRFLNRLSLLVMRYFDKVIAVSDEIRIGLEQVNIPSEKILVLKNVPSFSDNRCGSGHRFRKKFGIPEDARTVVGFMGRLEVVKGCDVFLKAAEKLYDQGVDCFFIIAGEGPERESLEHFVVESGLEKNVCFCGFCSEPSKLFSVLDLYILPSRSEGIPLTLLEAMAVGVPVVATRVGGVPEVLTDGKDGILVASEDPDVLEQAIRDVLSNRKETAKRAANARITIDKMFNQKKWIKKIEDLYHEIVESKQSS